MEVKEFFRARFSDELVLERLLGQVVVGSSRIPLLWSQDLPSDFFLIIGNLKPVASVFEDRVRSCLLRGSLQDGSA
jgi:hypothetical protein